MRWTSDCERVGRSSRIPVCRTARRASGRWRAEGVDVVEALADVEQVDIVVAHAAASPAVALLDVTSADELGRAWDAVVDTVDLYRRALHRREQR